ncbi:PAP2 family protein [Aphelenchoides besseyi]|nr:PAP2 family protein [Aphelenchoides besseyi]KAI6193663.1 PAP2 family protein [Aphelenchoides besseyi]
MYNNEPLASMSHEIPIAEPNESFAPPRRLPIARYCLDAVLVFTMGIGLELFCRIYGPFKRGFFCDDESIRYPYLPQSVTLFALLNYCFLTNCLIILSTEIHRLRRSETVNEHYSNLEHGRTFAGRLIVRFAIFFGYAMMSMLIVLTLTTAAKYPVGRLRPHFMDVCRPNIGYDFCNTTTYIPASAYNCTGTNKAAILEARLSFFSGHASLSAAAATFAVFYMQDRLAGQIKSRVLVPCAQTLVYIVALWIGYTRIYDDWHHWSDVFLGCVVGTTITTILCKYVAGLIPNVYTINGNEKTHLLSHHPDTGGRSFLCNFCRQRPASDLNQSNGLPNESLA